MMKEALLARIEALREEARQALLSLHNLKELQDCKVRLLGRKGVLTEVLKSLNTLQPEERPVVGGRANQVKAEIESRLTQLQKTLETKERNNLLRSQSLDVTLPGLQTGRGFYHPLNTVMKEIETIFVRFGFSIYEGPDVETAHYNFEALHFPPDHPAICMQDTFYIGGIAAPFACGECGPHPPEPLSLGPAKPDPRSLPIGGAAPFAGDVSLLLRTHTSPVQIRVMEKQKPPIAMIAPGAVYRHDDDVTHSPMFHQVEGLMVDTQVTFADLKGVLTLFCQTVFGHDRDVRFRPSFFPFVEPGAEVDISCQLCKGKGCRICGGDGWLEILGAGMVHPAVFEGVGIDPKRYSGFAFGMGVERIAMLKYGIDDIRLFYENDMRFLEQF